MRSTKAQNQAFRESGIGRKYPLSAHYADGVKNGAARVRSNPSYRDYYSAMARGAANDRYADWPPYRAYQLGFARGARTA